MKRKGILSLLLISAIIFAGCNKKVETAPIEAEEVKEESSETASDQEKEEVAESDEAATETVDEGVKPIQLIVTDHYKCFYYDGYNTLYEYTYGSVSLTDKALDEYPELVVALSNSYDPLAQLTKDAAERTLPEAMEWYDRQKEYSDIVYGNYSDNNSLSVLRADSNVVSIRNDFYSYLGGAHGSYGYTSNNFDTETGKLLTIDDVFTSKDELADVLYAKLADYGTEAFYDYDNMRENIMQEINDNTLIFDMDYVGINVFFNPYDLGPYAAGMFTVNLPYSEYAGSLLTEKVSSIPDNYIVDFPAEGELSFSLNGNGNMDLIQINSNMPNDSDYDYLDKVSVTVNDKTAEAGCYGYNVDYYLLKNADNYYIYFFCHGENDYVYPIVFEITGGEPKFVEAPQENCPGISPAQVYLSGDYDSDDYYAYDKLRYSFLDPQCMYMTTNTSVMSTTGGTAFYKVSDNGYPVRVDPNAWMDVLSDYYIFTAKMDVTGTQINEDGSEVGPYTIKAGSQCKYYRTDGLTGADVILEDGTIVRFELNTYSWPIMVDGKDLEEAFEGIIFAG